MRFGQQRDRRFAQRHRRREIKRQAGNNAFDRFAERKDIFSQDGGNRPGRVRRGRNDAAINLKN